MKKIVLILLCFCFLLVGCESEQKLEAAHISEITGARSTSYAIKVTLDDDKRIDDKYVELQIKCSDEGQVVSIGQELKDSYNIYFPKKDFWYNLTYLTSVTNGVKTEEGYMKFEEFGNKVFNLKTDSDTTLTFRVVVGDKKENEQTGDEILVLSEPISKEVTVKMKKFNE